MPTARTRARSLQSSIGLRERAATGALTSPELAGGTFTVAVAAVGSIRSLAPVLNQGQAAALAVGPVTDRPLVVDGEVVAGRALTATLSCDGRMIGTAEAARFLERVRDPAGSARVAEPG